MTKDSGIMRPIWLEGDSGNVKIIDQRQLPHVFKVVGQLPLVDDFYIPGVSLQPDRAHDTSVFCHNL
jgi:hypothetical protein